MDLLISVIAFLVIFSLIILIHEFGHFYVAKKSGIKVEEFGMGLPPRIWGKKFKGTLYSINWIPFGGFVRLFGEDAVDSKVLKSKNSFSSKPLRNRMAVVCAGVFMNFLLAVFLLTIGFSFGIEPLIVNEDDVYKAINENVIEIDNNIKIKEVDEGGVAYKSGLRAGDVITKINGEKVKGPNQFDVINKPLGEKDITVEIMRGTEFKEIIIPGIKEVSMDGTKIGLKLYDVIYLSHVFIKDVKPESETEAAGIKQGDIILKMNNKLIYDVSDYLDVINNENIIEYEILRDNVVIKTEVEFFDKYRVAVVDIASDTPAEKAGFKENDVILQINDKEITVPEEAIKITGENIGKELFYKIDRNGEILDIKVTPAENGKIGVGLMPMLSYKNSQLEVYNYESLISVIKVNNIQYPFLDSVGHAWNESWRLAGITVDMFGRVVKSIVSQFVVPEGVAGPIGIARMTYDMAGQGLLALLRFTALLSLSLAVLNILPFPGLDGGRLLFLLIEAVRGKRVPAKWESAIHGIGFLILLGLIFFVTYSDILNLFL